MELGKIKSEEFKSFLSDDLKLSTSPKLAYLLESKATDGKDFTTILKHIDILKNPGETTKSKIQYSNKHNKFKRDRTPPKTKLNQEDPLYDIKKWTLKLANGSITPDNYRSFLSENNINPNIEEINKHLRAGESGRINFNDLMFSIMRFEKSKNDPTKVNFEYKPVVFNQTTLEDEDTGKSYLYKKGSSQPFFANRKKDIECRYNSFNSHKEYFDWDANTLSTIDTQVSMTPKTSRWSKMAFESHIFDEDFNKEDAMKKKPHRSSTSYHKDNGDIFKWSQHKDNFSSSARTGLKRIDPNFKKSEQKNVELKKKNLSMLMSSQDNFFTKSK